MYFDINNIDFKDKKIIVRVDYNVPIKEGIIQNDLRIKASIETINLLLKKGAEKIILMSHVGRPKGQFVKELSTEIIAKRLSELINLEVSHVKDCIDYEIPESKISLLENLRFYKEETKNDLDFSEKLAKGFDYYINDAFGTCHREEASVHGITNFIPSIPGLLLQKEIETLTLENPKRPFVFILGGAKLDTKLPIIKTMLNKADKILLGGAMIFDFYKAKGFEIGTSLFEEEMINEARELLNNEKIILPEDVVIAKEFSNESEFKTVDVNNIDKDWKGLDIGNKTIETYSEILKNAKTIAWNGPMGVFEFENFAKGTNEIAKILSNLNAKTIIGGGDSASAIEKLNLQDKFYHISTGGGASLELLSGKSLPALEALKQNFEKFK
jgi:3-phosphoglycerate kinase